MSAYDEIYQNIKNGKYKVPEMPLDTAEQRAEYRKRSGELINQFQRDMENAFGTYEFERKDRLFGKAWEIGHSSGLTDVLGEYSDLVGIVPPSLLRQPLEIGGLGR